MKKTYLYNLRDGCPDHYEEWTFYCYDGNDIEKASDYRKKLYKEGHVKGGCTQKQKKGHKILSSLKYSFLYFFILFFENQCLCQKLTKQCHL